MPTTKRSKFQVRSDAAKQRWVRDEHKEAFWRRHMEAWKNSGLSKRGYCKAHNLSESSFNAWSRELTIRDREYKPTANVEALLKPDEFEFLPLKLVHNNAGTAPVPEDIADSSTPVAVAETPSSGSAGVDVFIPGGAILRVTNDSCIDLVSKLFSTLIRP